MTTVIFLIALSKGRSKIRIGPNNVKDKC